MFFVRYVGQVGRSGRYVRKVGQWVRTTTKTTKQQQKNNNKTIQMGEVHVGSKSCYWPGRNWRHKPPPPQTSKVSGPQIWCLGICLAIFWWTMFRHLQCIIYFFVQRHLAASRPSSGRRNMQWWPKQIQIASPNLIVSASGSEIENPIEMKYEKQPKQIQFSSSPNLIVKKKHSQAFSEFSGTLWQS